MLSRVRVRVKVRVRVRVGVRVRVRVRVRVPVRVRVRVKVRPLVRKRSTGVAWRCVFTLESQCNFGVASLNATPTSKIVFLLAILMKFSPFSLVISKDIFRDVREELYLFRPVGFVKIHCS